MTTNSETLIYDIASLIAKDWYRQAVRNPFGEFYLWYRAPVEGERIALPIAALGAPDENYRQSIRISGAWSGQQAARQIAAAMLQLPILGPGLVSHETVKSRLLRRAAKAAAMAMAN